MSWKKYFRSVTVPGGTAPQISTSNLGVGGSAGTSSKFSSYLPEVYAGHPNRVQRYYQYDDMDRDSDINAALDTIADFCTQSEEQNDQPFVIVYSGEANETEVKLLKAALAKWNRLNDFRSRLWHMVRNIIKYGDQFFIRDPETGEWEWLDPFSIESVRVDEEAGKEPTDYVIRGLDYAKQQKLGNAATSAQDGSGGFGANTQSRSNPGGGAAGGFALAGGHVDPRQRGAFGGGVDQSWAVESDHVIHLSLSVGMDINWPFGQSVLDPIFKTFKQKELLEDAIIIYRVQRAPERRIFYIDTGSMPPVRAKAHIEQIKNEIHQRRIPNRTGGGSSVMDASYNPMSIMEDYFFAQTSDGRGSKVETLPGGDQVGEITDLSFFTKKLARGLRIPPSYLSIGDDQQGGAAYNDGKVGAALIQEYRFTKYCMRIQSLIAPKCDAEFKRFVRLSGIEIDETMFDLHFNPPQNFSKYRQMEVDAQQVQVYSGLSENKRLSERFKLKRFLNLTEEEILENERMWSEENPTRIKKVTGSTPGETAMGDGLSSVGLRGGGMDMGMDPGFEPVPDEGTGGDPMAAGGDMPDAGGDAAGGAAAGGAPPADAPPAPPA